MKKLKYIKPEAEVVHFHLMDGDLYTLSGGQNGNETGGGSDPYTSDLGMHLAFAQRGMIYSTVSLLIGPAYALAGRIGIAVLLAAFHLAAVAVFAYGLRTALPDAPRPARLLVSLVANLATAVWMPRGGYWYQGTVGGTIYHNTTYIMLAPFALLAMLAFYRVWPTMRGDLDLRAYAVYTVLLTVATSFKASLIFACLLYTSDAADEL